MATPDRACPDYPNECVHPWAHARTYAEVKATQTDAPVDLTVSLSIAEGRLADVRAVADWLAANRGRRDDGQVYADLAELKLRTALGEHKPDGPCTCPACRRPSRD